MADRPATALFTHPDAIPPAWLAQQLGAPTNALKSFEYSAVGTGQMCDSYRLTLDWDPAPASDRHYSADCPAPWPTSVIAKCPSLDPASRAIAAQLGSYRLEVRFYQTLAAAVAVARPACHFAEIADNDVDFLLLLGDLAPARQGDQIAGATDAQLFAAVDAAGALHAPLWKSAALDNYPWLHRDTRPLVKAMFPTLYAGFRERYAGWLAPDILDLGAAIIPRLDAYLDRAPHAPTVTHGDFRVDNLLFATDNRTAWVVDWQTCGIGSGATDVAYLVGTSIADPNARQRLDHAAFDHWLSALTARGVTPDRAALWTDYRIGALSGYFMAVFASMSVERTERGDKMFAVMAARPALQALSLGSLDLL